MNERSVLGGRQRLLNVGFWVATDSSLIGRGTGFRGRRDCDRRPSLRNTAVER